MGTTANAIDRLLQWWKLARDQVAEAFDAVAGYDQELEPKICSLVYYRDSSEYGLVAWRDVQEYTGFSTTLDRLDTRF